MADSGFAKPRLLGGTTARPSQETQPGCGTSTPHRAPARNILFRTEITTKKTITPAAALVGAALVGSLGAFGLAQAAGNPFAAQPLDSGYTQLADADTEGKCGEGKCGADKAE
jgi:hypothetical protein